MALPEDLHGEGNRGQVEEAPGASRIGVVKATIRLLTFRITAEELAALDGRHLAFGAVCTWIVGMGRFWDDPNAVPYLRAGLGSLGYILGLTLVLRFSLDPLNPKPGSLRRLLTFVALTSPPGILYAIPVELWTSPEAARSLNLAFLLAVASWRLGLALVLLPRLTGLGWAQVMSAVMLPICAAIVILSVTNCLDQVFEFMGGFRKLSPEELARNRLWSGIGWSSCTAGLFFAILYVSCLMRRVGTDRQSS